MKRLLVIQMARLGDFIQSTALLANLRHNSPEAEIYLLGKEPAVLAAAALSPLVDGVLDSPQAAVGLGFFDAVYVLNSHPEAAGAGALVRSGEYFGPRLRGGELSFPPAQLFLMGLMRAGRRLGRFNLVDVWSSLLPGASARATFWPETEKPAALLGSGPPLVGLQLGCRNHLRRWPVEYFVNLIQELGGQGGEVRPVLLGSADERALARKFRALWGREELIDLVGATDLASLAGAVGALDLLVSGDTGVMHLAAARQRPVLALFLGPAYGPETGPYGPGHIIYQAAADCGPCLENSACRRRQCLELPRPEIAAAWARRLLNRDLADSSAGPPPLPAGHRLWRSSLGAFGQDLIPLEKPLLNRPELLALLLTEAGRRIVRPSYQSRPEELAGLIAFYRAEALAPLDYAGEVAPMISGAFGRNSREGKAFGAEVEFLAASLGLDFA